MLLIFATRLFAKHLRTCLTYSLPLPEQTAITNYLDAKTEQITRFIAKEEKADCFFQRTEASGDNWISLRQRREMVKDVVVVFL
jgi:hypothetical protein